ncbi:aminopeptidase [Paenibacillus doosanensis]|uniref:Aminopeptidase 2 n=1 Tax=Paenibacillus konkukensis TaxID=2020716 RepID=A0ABY4RQT2_9BACL|nr:MULTISPECIES: aminopeptidase [Paenibacillus]MCS7459091.1 aminopeptidase [Paenibacillus doosanensis]UQZ84146.1 Aminopeptidase 2 [Paenibacillus konkukensis]
MKSFDVLLEQYAELALRVGLNVREGQTLVVSAPIAAVDFVRQIARKAYEAGVWQVIVDWDDEELRRIKLLHAGDEALRQFPRWKADGYAEMARDDAAFLTVYAPNPELLEGIDSGKIALAARTQMNAMKEHRANLQSGKVSWSIVSVPTPSWATKVFPELTADEAVQKLWGYIFRATRLDQDNPVKAWEDHIRRLQERVKLLNGKRYRKLHYEAPGTQLTVELPEEHLWVAGGIYNERGTFFVPNLPTEEVFTLPHKHGINGKVTSTMPLNYNGNLIDRFTLTFERGRIVDFSAEQGYEALKQLIETDEGSHFLGEVALVPHGSPISAMNVIFYNTGFDENASAHLAIGSAYPLCVVNGTKMSKEQLAAAGANSSMTHVDFMIGSAELNIDGETAGGAREPLFRSGKWA